MRAAKARAKSAELTRWEFAETALLALIQRIAGAPTPHGTKWRDKMLLHYEKKLVELRETRPPR